MTQTGKPPNQTQKAAFDVRILKDDELDAVSGWPASKRIQHRHQVNRARAANNGE